MEMKAGIFISEHIVKSSGTGDRSHYTVTVNDSKIIDSCTCSDFEEDERPCKHMHMVRRHCFYLIHTCDPGSDDGPLFRRTDDEEDNSEEMEENSSEESELASEEEEVEEKEKVDIENVEEEETPRPAGIVADPDQNAEKRISEANNFSLNHPYSRQRLVMVNVLLL
jgi:hypothetical protein